MISVAAFAESYIESGYEQYCLGTPNSGRSYARRAHASRTGPRSGMSPSVGSLLGEQGQQPADQRLLMFANGIAERIKELQTIAAEETVESAEKMTRELNEVLREARADKAHSAAVSAILGKAKILNISERHDFRSGQIDF